MKIAVIGDVHGCVKTLKALDNKIPEDYIRVFAGDLIDRGPNSKEAVEYIIQKGYLCVLGNHEDMMLDFLLHKRAGSREPFFYNGGKETLESYGYHFNQTEYEQDPVIKKHLEWMNELPIYLEFENVKNAKGQHLIVSHSAAEPAWHYKDTVDKHEAYLFCQTLLWGRKPDIKPIPGIYNVFGHTPHQDNPRVKSHYANIDTGCVFKNKLTALVFPDMITIDQEYID